MKRPWATKNKSVELKYKKNYRHSRDGGWWYESLDYIERDGDGPKLNAAHTYRA